MQNKHRDIASFIINQGEKYPKKHGEWIKYKLVGNIYLTIDSWNESIWIIRNAKYDNYWTGFSGEKIKYLGMDFGGYESCVKEEELDNILIQCKRNIICGKMSQKI
jgi:hypothetical protein